MGTVNDETQPEIDLGSISDSVLEELTRRVQAIDNSYRAVAQKMGQLYMCADAHMVTSLTRTLDKPMLNASDNEQTFAAILEKLRMHALRQR